MRIRRSMVGHWFYGCSRWPDCAYTFDADQNSGAPIVHMRYGLPFRTARKEGTAGALFDALKRDGFDLEAGQRLEQAQKRSRAKRLRALKNIGRAEVETRLEKAAPNTRDEWVEFVLAERVRAVQDYHEEVKLRAQVTPQIRAARRNPLPDR